jgi:hypothetical protein
MPERLVRSITPDWLRLSQKPGDSNFLDPLIDNFPKPYRSLLPALLGYARDYELFRDAFYLEREKRESGK